MSTAYIWHLWPARHWPSSKAEEEKLVSELTNLDPTPATFDRSDITAVLNVLRLGMTFAEVIQHAPGLRPGRLLGAYTYLEKERKTTSAAFVALLDSPSVGALESLAAPAARILPIPTFWLSSAIREADESENQKIAEDAVHQIRYDIAAAVNRARIIEKKLASLATPDEEAREKAVELGREIYDPYADSAWEHPFYLPTRVGALMPNRVADLIGETP